MSTDALAYRLEAHNTRRNLAQLVRWIGTAVDKVTSPVTSAACAVKDAITAWVTPAERELSTEGHTFGNKIVGEFKTKSEVEIMALMDAIERRETDGEAARLIEKYGENIFTLVRIMRNRFDEFSRNVGNFPLTAAEISDQNTSVLNKEQISSLVESGTYLVGALFMYAFGSDYESLESVWSVGKMLPEWMNQFLHIFGGFLPSEVGASSEITEIQGAIWRAVPTFCALKMAYKGGLEPLKDGSWSKREWQIARDQDIENGVHPFGAGTTVDDAFESLHDVAWGFGDIELLELSFDDADLEAIGFQPQDITKIRKSRGLEGKTTPLDISLVAVRQEIAKLHGQNPNVVPIRQRLTAIETDTINARLNSDDAEISEENLMDGKKDKENNAGLILAAGLLRNANVMINIRGGLFECTIDGSPACPPSVDIKGIYNALENALCYREMIYGEENCPDIDVFLMIPHGTARSGEVAAGESPNAEHNKDPYKSIERRFKELEDLGGIKIHTPSVPEVEFAQDFAKTLNEKEVGDEAKVYIDTSKAQGKQDERRDAIKALISRKGLRDTLSVYTQQESDEVKKITVVDNKKEANVVLIVNDTDGDTVSDVRDVHADYGGVNLVVYNYDTRRDPVPHRYGKKSGIASRHQAGISFLRTIFEAGKDKHRVQPAA